MTRVKGWLHAFAAALVASLLACGGSQFCPDCEKAVPVASAGYPASLPEAVQGSPYTLQPAPRGGSPSQYLVVSGALPLDLVLDPATGRISGTPVQAGVSHATIQATNGAGGTDQSLTFVVRPPGPLTLAYGTPLTFPAGSPIPTQNPTLGNATPGLEASYSLGSTALPPGLALGSDGAITGTPTTIGPFGFTVTAASGARSASCDLAYTISPAGSLALNYYDQPAATTVNTAFGPLSPTLSNATPQVATSFTVTTGSLPTGLALSAAGVLSGTPTAAGSTTFTITAANGTRTATATLTVLVIAAPTATSLVPATSTPAYRATVALTPTFAGGAATIGTTGIGSSDVAATATSGTPVVSGTITSVTTFTLTVTNTAGTRTSTSCTVTPQTVSGVGITPATPYVTAGLTQAFTATFTGGATGRATWVASGGSFADNVWTAPAITGTYNITATSVDDPTRTVGTTATVVALPVAVSLTPSTGSPRFADTVTLTPVFTGGTGQIGTTGPGSSNVAVSVTSGQPVTSAAVRAATTFTLTVTNLANTQRTSTCLVTPQTVTLTNLAPAAPRQTVGTTRTFSVTVAGGATNQVTWTASAGTFSGATWTAPGTAGGVTITATSVDDPNQKATANATVVAQPAAISLVPSTTSPAYGASVNLVPTFTGATATIGSSGAGSTEVTASATSGGSYASGSITASTTFTLTVANNADTPAVANTTCTVAPSSVTIGTITPADGYVTLGTTQAYTASVTGGLHNTLTWHGSGGTFAGNVWTPPVTAGTYLITAVSDDDPLTTRTTNATTVAVPVATSLVASTESPLFGATITLTPHFTGSSATIGTAGAGSSNVTGSAADGVAVAYATPITATTTFTLTVSNLAGTQRTAPAEVVTPQTVAVSTPVNLTTGVLTGGPGVYAFSASASNAVNTAVTWHVDAGAGSIDGTGHWTSPNTVGDYVITATSVADPTKSTPATFHVVAPQNVTASGGGSFCPADTPVLSVTADYATGYQWYLGGVLISGATGTTYTLPSVDPSHAGTYTCRATNAASPAGTASNPVVVAAYPLPAITIVSGSQTVASGGTATLTVTVDTTGGHGPFTYAWYEGAAPAPGSASGLSYTTGPLTVDTTYHFQVTDGCGRTVSSADMTVTIGVGAPLIVTQPLGLSASDGASGPAALARTAALDPAPSGSFAVTASGPGPLAYQWFRIPAGTDATGLQNPVGDGGPSLTLDAAALQAANDGDQYFVLIGNAYGQAVSAPAPLAVGNGILLQAAGQPRTAFAAAGAGAAFTVTVASADPGALQYQWYACPPGATAFAPVPGATAATCTLPAVLAADSGTLYRCRVTSIDPGVSPVTSRDAALFVDGPGLPGGLADGWRLNGDAVMSGSGIQLVAAAADQAGSAFWPAPVSTARLSLAFTVTLDNPGPVPGDGFALVLADPSRGAAATSLGASGPGLGARGIPGAVLAFDTRADGAQGVPGQPGYLPADLPVPFLGLGRGEPERWGQPWQLGFFALPGFPGSATDPAAALRFAASRHAYRVTVADGILSVTMDGAPVLTGAADLPPAALVGFTAATSAGWQRVVVTDLSASLSAP